MRTLSFGQDTDLAKLNSLTKYPSIPTLHAMGKKGRLTEERVDFDGPVHVTEKIDGTNTRIIMAPGGDYIIGSREELLWHSGDVCHNPALGIVERLRADIDARGCELASPREFLVYYGEVYGGKINGAKQYTGHRSTGFRLFDVMQIHVDDYHRMMLWDRPRIASWREHGGQEFLSVRAMRAIADDIGWTAVPSLGVFDDIPETHEATLEWLESLLPETEAALDADAQGRPEGVVLRTAGRHVIAKARFDDYRRTLGVRR